MDTQASIFYGHVTLGLRIHFPYLSQPDVSKICSLINSCIHSSPFWVFREIFAAFTLQVHTHFFKTGVMISESFSKEKLEVISFQKRAGFSARQFYFSFSFFIFLHLLSYYYLFISFFSEKVVRIRAHTVMS